MTKKLLIWPQWKKTEEFPLILIWVHFTKNSIFFSGKSFVKFFPIFKLESDFFHIFFLQNQKNRKLCTFNYLELQLRQFSAKSAKKKIFQNFKNWIGFFSDFFLQNHKTRKLRNLTFYVLHVCQVSAEPKKWPLHVGIFEPKFPKFHHNFPNFQLETWVFLIFQKKSANFRKLRNLTFLKLQLSQFSAKLEKLFFSSSSSSSEDRCGRSR